jgi:glycosyltransferase involved in cell wall biosynthesis
MKIAFNAIRVSNKAGSGFDTFIINFVNEFARYVYSNKLNIDFDVYTLYPQHFPEVKKENIKQVKIPFIRQKLNIDTSTSTITYKIHPSIHTSIPQIAGSTHPLIYFLADYFRMFWTQFVFPFYAKKYDLIIALTEYDACIFLRNQLLIVHNTVPFFFPNLPTKYKFYTYKLLPRVFKKCQKIITVSDVLKKELVKLFNIASKKNFVVYEGVDFKKFFKADENEVLNFKEKYQINEDFVLAVGHSHPIKNFSGVIEAFKIVRKKYKIKLVIAGLTGKKVVQDRDIIYVGHIPNDKLYILYSAAKCFIFPTLHEGFGLPPLEAMACGCPVVVSDKGSLPEVCGEAAVYVDPYNPQSIAEGILKVLTDENLRQSLIQKGYQQVKKFSWEQTVKKFLEVLNYK